MNFHAKSGVCSSKNERVMALGTKEDGHTHTLLLLSIVKRLYSPNLEFGSSQVWTITKTNLTPPTTTAGLYKDVTDNSPKVQEYYNCFWLKVNAKLGKPSK